jgi:hypothetical protein
MATLRVLWFWPTNVTELNSTCNIIMIIMTVIVLMMVTIMEIMMVLLIAIIQFNSILIYLHANTTGRGPITR